MTYYSIPGIKTNIFIPVNLTEELRLEQANNIIERVASFYNVAIEKVFTKGRSGDLPKVRQISCYLICRRFPQMKLTEIARLFGSLNYDHSMIIHNRELVKDWYKVNDPIIEDVNTLSIII